MEAFLKHIAKAIAALVVPWILVALAWFTDSFGVDLGLDATVVELAVLSVVTAGLVYLVPNRYQVTETGEPEPSTDSADPPVQG